MNTKQLIAILVIELILLFPIAHAFSVSQPSVTVSGNSAVINWTTSVPADSEVQYGKTTSKDLRKTDSSLLILHNILLDNLEEFTKYYYKVVSKDENNTLASYPPSGSGQELSFITLDLTPPPKVEDLTLIEAKSYTVEIQWKHVNVIDFKRYEIFRDGEYIGETTQISYKDTNLLPGMPYEYKVRAVDDYENFGEFSDIIFVNTIGEDRIPPVISNLRLGALSPVSATVLWDTNEDANSKLYYGVSESLGLEEIKSTFVKEHSVSINGLSDGQNYYYKVESCDEMSNCAQSEIRYFVAGSDYTPPTINTDIPNYYNKLSLNFNLETEPFSDVKIYVNDIISRSSNSGEEGLIYFENIILKSILPVNLIKITAQDFAGNYAEEEYSIYLDFKAPELVIQTNVSQEMKKGSFSVQGYVNEQSMVSFYVEQEPFSFLPPEKIKGLNLKKIDQGLIELSWNRSNANDLDEYLVYREDVGLIGIAGTEMYTDTNIFAGQTYKYWVSALDYDCLEGEYSDVFIVKALEGENAEIEEIEQMIPECRQKIPVLQIETSGSFNAQLAIKEGNNKLIIIAEDIYGNSVNVTYDSLYDSQPPIFNSINLANINPSYNQQITIKGNMSEPCMVIVEVNGKNVSMGETDEKGMFSVSAKLDKGNPIQSSSGSIGWNNDVKVIAIDRAGNKVETKERIDFMMCGSSNPMFAVIPKNLAPSELTPRLLYEGFGQITFELELQWLGYDEEPRVTSNVDDLQLSMEQEENYDSNIISSINDYYMGSPGDQSIAVIIDINKIDPTTTDKNWTIYDIEKNISKRHSGHCFTHADLMSGGIEGINGPGCIRLPLEIELRYPLKNYDGTSTTQTQKECMFVDVLIQPAVDVGGSIPKGLLEDMVDMLDSFIEIIDKVLEPIRTVSTYLMYGCLGMNVVYIATKTSEWFSCQKLLVGEALGIDSCNDCEINTNGEVITCSSDCQSCVSARLRTYSVEKAMHLLCDRTQCNSIPSFSTYAHNQEQYSFSSEESACAAFTGSEKTTIDYTADDNSAEGFNPLKYNEATLISTFGNQPCDICAVLPTADYCVNKPECCAIQYKEEWDSASLFTNEIKESACRAVNEPGIVITNSEVKDANCGSAITRLFRGVRDFSLCKGEQQIARFEQGLGVDEFLVMVKVKEKAWTNPNNNNEKEDMWELAFKTRNYGNNNIIYTDGTSPTPEDSGVKYIYAPLRTNQEGGVTDYTVDVGDVEKKLKDTGDFDYFISDMYSSSTPPFSAEHSVVAYTKSKCTDIVSGTLKYGEPNWPKYIYPQGDLNTRIYEYTSGSGYQLQNPNFVRAELPVSFANFICEGYQPKESHILDPTSGLLKAMEAVCIPAIEGYLSQTRTLMSTMKGCINQILVTGEGSAGYCQQFLSMYVCDMLYYTLSCVKKMTPGSSNSRGYSTGIAGFGQYLLTSIQETQRGIENRYGSDSSMATLLSGKELFNSVCMAMFGADIDFDFGAMIDMSVQPNIEPMVDVTATRRFTGINPNDGYVSFVYNIFPLLITEMDINYQIILVCSDSYTCNPDYGYENGRCDCAGIGEKSVVVHGGRLNAGDVLGDDGDEELFKEVTAKYRYDKVILQYSYIAGQNSRIQDRGNRIDQTVESNINAVGGLAPAYCFLRVSTEPEFRCNLAADEGARARFIDPVVTAENNVKILTDKIYLNEKFINENSTVKMHIESLQMNDYNQKMPVYLVATLTNNRNKVVETVEGSQIMQEQVVTFDKNNDPFQFSLKQEHFSDSVGKCFTHPDRSKTVCITTSEPSSLLSTDIISFEHDGALKSDAGGDNIFYLRYVLGDSSWYFYETNVDWPHGKICSVESDEKTIVCPKVVQGLDNNKIMGITVKLPEDYTPANNNQLRLEVKDGVSSSNTEHTFKLKLELYNSKKSGTTFDMDSTKRVIYNGVEQTIIYEYQVVNGNRPEATDGGGSSVNGQNVPSPE